MSKASFAMLAAARHIGRAVQKRSLWVSAARSIGQVAPLACGATRLLPCARASGALTRQRVAAQPISVHHQRVRFLSAAAAANELTIKVPVMGESITEGTVVQFPKAVGDVVSADEVIAIIETDKVTVEVRAASGGVVTKHLATLQQPVKVGAPLLVIDTTAKPIQPPAAELAPQPSPIPPAESSPGAPEKPVESGGAEQPVPPPTPTQAPPMESTAAHTAALPGKESAPASEVKVAAPPTAPAPKPKKATPSIPIAPKVAGARTERRVPMSRMRQKIAERLKFAQNTTASLTTFNEIDMSNISKARKQFQDEFQKKHKIKLGFMSAFVRGATLALQEVQGVNARLDVEAGHIVYHDYVDISVAVGTPTGLVTPVVRNCHLLSFADIEKEVSRLGKLARDSKLTVDQLTGGTFTITNGGVYGSMMSTPIINPPQAAVLGMHAVKDRAVIVKGKVEVRPMMYVALTYDHRLIDGKDAVTFLKKVKEYVEEPHRMLFGL